MALIALLSILQPALPPGSKKFSSDIRPMIFQHCAGASGLRKLLVTMASAISLRQDPVRKWACLFFWDGGSTKVAHLEPFFQILVSTRFTFEAVVPIRVDASSPSSRFT